MHVMMTGLDISFNCVVSATSRAKRTGNIGKLSFLKSRIEMSVPSLLR